ncbi:MAG TPA: MOSC domain-containing protein [Terriglobia bacterium]|nr:MOSC domain-containing protein [Terriglobia bacterium]
MKLISINVSLPTVMGIAGEVVQTGIFKKPVAGLVRVRSLNIDGDGQADLTVHGGPDKAVYIYPSEHYRFWEQELRRQFPEWGTFGENLTIEGILENDISVGDCLEIGTVMLQVTQPRLPCFKLAAKLERDDIIKRLLDSRRTGFYTRVLQEGSLQAGDKINVSSRDPQHLTVREITDLYMQKDPDRARIERALSVAALSAAWRRHFEKSLV